MKTGIINAIVVDDEQKCIANLCYYLSKYCPLVQVVGTADTQQDAQRLFDRHKPDVAFLDIEIGNDNIFSVLDNQQLNTKTIFVTAYEQYAIRAIKAEALDYLLKPLSKEDITACYEKIIRQFGNKTANVADTKTDTQPTDTTLRKVILRQGEHVFIVKQSDIYYLKARGFYTEVFFDFKGGVQSILVSKPISILEQEYNAVFFFRLHKSYLINTQKVTDIIKGENTSVKLLNNHIIPIAKRRVTDFLLFLNRQS